MALDDLYVLDLKQMFEGQDIHNIFSYQRTDEGSAIDLNDAFVEDMLPLINDMQHEDIINVSLNTINLGNLGDNGFLVLTGAGVLTGSDMLPLHDAVNFTLKPTNRAVRPGSKRFSGIPEIEQVGGTITQPTYITTLNALRVGLETNIAAEAENFYQPIVIKRVKYEVPDSDPVRYAYRFPEIGETPVISTLAGVLLNTHVSHQVSRY